MVQLILVSILSVFSATPKQSETQIFELLSMPTQNSAQLIKGKPELFKDLKTIAFSSKFPISARWRAISLLIQSENPENKSILDEAIEHQDWFIRNAALLGAKGFGQAKQDEIAMKLLKDKALVVRSAAVGAMSEPQGKTREILWKEMNATYNFHRGQSLWVRSEILEKLALSPHSVEKPLFQKALKEKDKRIQEAAKKALANLSSVAQKRVN